MTTTSTTMKHSSFLVLALVFLSCFHCYPAAHHGRKHVRPPLTAAAVLGSIHSGAEPTKAISGTLVAVRCHDGNGRTVFQKEAVTDRHGTFHVHLAQEPSGWLRSVTSCSVHLLQQPSGNNNAPPGCAVMTTSTCGLHLVAPKRHGGGGAQIFSAGVFAIRARELCGQKGIFFPPIPLVPEPRNVGGVPIPPNPITPAPPSLVPPVLPTPSPPSVLPPLVPQPLPSSIVPPLPPLLPRLVHPPPPPPPPQLLPPLFPGVPPLSASKSRRPGTP